MTLIRPKVTLFISSSLDGRITGDYGAALRDNGYSSRVFQRIGFERGSDSAYDFQAWIYGANTSRSYFAKGVPQIDASAPTVAAGDYIDPNSHETYYVAFDRHGELNWESDTTSYGGHQAGVIEVLTPQASNGYKAFLRERGISYIIAGKSDIDIPVVLTKLATIWHMTNVLLGGGGILNWSFVAAGLCDEIGMIVVPAIDGRRDTARLFDSGFADNPKPVGFTLKSCKVLENSTLWLQYIVNNAQDFRLADQCSKT